MSPGPKSPAENSLWDQPGFAMCEMLEGWDPPPMGLSSQGKLTGLGVRWPEAAGMRGCGAGLRNILFLWCSVSSAAWPDGWREIYIERQRETER